MPKLKLKNYSAPGPTAESESGCFYLLFFFTCYSYLNS